MKSDPSVRFVLLLGALLSVLGPVRAETPAVKLLVRNATIITLEEGQTAPFSGYLTVGKDGRILSVGEGSPPAGLTADTAYDAGGKVVMPGFLSGHSHLWQSAFRGIAADQWVTNWVQKIHRTYGPFFQTKDPYYFTLHGALDYLRHGITTTYNYSQNLNFTPELYGEQLQAEFDAGGRFIFGYALTPTPSLEVVKRNFAAFYSKLKALPPNPLLLKLSIASGGLRGGAEYTKFEFDLMREYDLDMQMHYLEGPPTAKVEQGNFVFIQQANGLSSKLVFAHFIHTNEEILSQAGAAGAGMIWNPLSNGRLASGLADIPKYIKAGIKVGMGLDGQASADISDPFENMRMGMYALRMKYEDPLVMLPIDVIKLHTIGTAKVLGVDQQVGTLKPGKFADFVVIDPSKMDTGPVFDLYATLVFACEISNLERVYVGGDFLIERGEPLKHDMAAITREVQTRVDGVRSRMTAALPRGP